MNKKKYLAYIKTLDEEVQNVLKWYTDEDGISDDLNDALRLKRLNKQELNQRDQKYYDKIMSAFDNSPTLDNKLTVYKGSNLFIEKEFFLDCFVSTSYDYKVAVNFVENEGYVYIITLEPGDYSVLFLEEIGSRQEKEILLPPKGKFVVNKIKPQENFTSIYMTYIPEKTKLCFIL
jgi:hypothetical protein